VDYWDKLGWKDPFGSKQMTEQQQMYAKPLALRGMYTPMIVVNGASHMPSPAEAAKKIAADVAPVASVEASGKKRATNAVIEAKVVAGGDSKAAAEVTVAVAENNLVTEIKAGELKGHTVTEHGVVRHLTKPAVADKEGRVTFEIPVSPEWKPENLYLAVIARDPGTKKVLGALRLEWKDLQQLK
jgi:hypothetical protein